MAKLLVIFISFLFSGLLFGQVPSPMSYQSGADFSHFSCNALSNEVVSPKNLFKRYRIEIKEFGFGDFNEASLLVKYEGNHNCIYKAKFHMPSNSNTLQFIESSATASPACMGGEAILDNFLHNGIKFKQSKQNPSRFSLELQESAQQGCTNENLFLEFSRTR